MKKVFLTIIAVAVTICISPAAEAKSKTNGWDFLNTFFTGKGLDPECIVVNSNDPAGEAMVIQSMDGAKFAVGVDSKGNNIFTVNE